MMIMPTKAYHMGLSTRPSSKEKLITCTELTYIGLDVAIYEEDVKLT